MSKQDNAKNTPSPKRAMSEPENGEVDVTFVDDRNSKPRRAKTNISKIVTGSGVGLSVVALVASAFINPVFANMDVAQYAVPAPAPSKTITETANANAALFNSTQSRAVSREAIPTIAAQASPVAIPTVPATVADSAVMAVSGNVEAAASGSTNIANGRLGWPVDARTTTSSFGPRIHPIKKTLRFHTGMDISAPCGAAVYAASDGVVVNSGYTSGAYGNRIVLKHTDVISTTYSHMSAVKVADGQFVREGDLIGLVGTTGLSTGCHMHFEVAKNGSYVNPWSWLTGTADPVTDTVPFSKLYTQGSAPVPGSTHSPAQTEDDGDVEISVVKPSIIPSPTSTPSVSVPSPSPTASAPAATPTVAPETPVVKPSPTVTQPVKEPSPVVTTPAPATENPSPKPEPTKPVETTKPEPEKPTEPPVVLPPVETKVPEKPSPKPEPPVVEVVVTSAVTTTAAAEVSPSA